MPRIAYVDRKFSSKSLTIIEKANEIVEEYEKDGFVLTLRQLYYQFVARALIPNSQKSYKSLGSIINDARLAGLLDWDAIEDRTRSLRKRSHWDDPSGVIESAASSYALDLWEGQGERCEVWIEKDALVGVIERVCTRWDVPYFSCRGYTSQSEVWRAAQRHKEYGCEFVTVIHLGDHDPSGIDMTRDIQDRLRIFEAPTTIDRIALNMDQVRSFKLPPNPAKATDARFEGYVEEHGNESWELDALDPKRIEKMIEKAIRGVLGEDVKKWMLRIDEQEAGRTLLTEASRRWDDVAGFLKNGRAS
jgi:hypothetical protein